LAKGEKGTPDSKGKRGKRCQTGKIRSQQKTRGVERPELRRGDVGKERIPLLKNANLACRNGMKEVYVKMFG